MPRNIKLTIEYDGSRFNGWQSQTRRSAVSPPPVGKSQRTVQEEIENALAKIFGHDIRLTGAGRTDSGVHALGQVAHFKTTAVMPVAKIKHALNAVLPKDIVIAKVEEALPDFHARFSARSKTYRYTILNREHRSAIDRETCLHYPHKLNLAAMRWEARSLIGKKDFKSFVASDPAKTKSKSGNTIRTITQLKIAKRGNHVIIDIEADGFLYKMARNIIGTLLDAGSGKLPKGAVRKILSQKDRCLAGKTAHAGGLMLVEVKY